MAKFTTAIYVHSTKESMLDLGESLGLKGEALQMFKYTAYEVALEIEVDEQTGRSVIVKVDGKKVEQ